MHVGRSASNCIAGFLELTSHRWSQIDKCATATMITHNIIMCGYTKLTTCPISFFTGQISILNFSVDVFKTLAKTVNHLWVKELKIDTTNEI